MCEACDDEAMSDLFGSHVQHTNLFLHCCHLLHQLVDVMLLLSILRVLLRVDRLLSRNLCCLALNFMEQLCWLLGTLVVLFHEPGGDTQEECQSARVCEKCRKRVVVLERPLHCVRGCSENSVMQRPDAGKTVLPRTTTLPCTTCSTAKNGVEGLTELDRIRDLRFPAMKVVGSHSRD